MSNFSKNLNLIAQDTDLYLKSVFLKQKKSSKLTESMKYGLFSGGKRFRSAIIVNAGKIFGIDYKKLVITGAAVECIHTYSLIHDDLPSMDNDDLRRGKPSVHKKFNEFTAILAGNSLLTLAFEILSGNDLKVSNNIKVDLIKSLSICSGNLGLAEGQYYDLTFENKKTVKKNIISLQKKKTGKLFGFCCESVGIIKRKNAKFKKELKEIGTNIGLLFQIVDDLIDYTGDPSVVGKPTRRDFRKGKPTLVNLMGYKETLNFAEKFKINLNEKIKKRYGIKAKDLLESIEFLFNRKF
tara:strand:+ start:102 stop:989 length:888 start_codon:yes stop_codon:yes gene_type:complete